MENKKNFENELIRIINGALRLDLDKVRNYTTFLADKLEESGDLAFSTRLRKLLTESDHLLKPSSIGLKKALPIDVDSRFPLIERIDLKNINDLPIVLPDGEKEIVQEFLSICKSHAQLEMEGVGGALSFLLYGPPGTGKSLLARQIARELGLELYVARLDGLISSFLGSTSKNIRALFDFASKTPCVLFLDEFDAIAKLRGDTQELGELKRVVNSFIQNLDNLDPHSIVIAATNHKELLDSAVWRRFNYRLELGFPSIELRKILWLQFLPPIIFSSREIEILVDLSDGFSGSDIYDVCKRLNRARIVTKDAPGIKEAFNILMNISIGEGENRRFIATLRGSDAEKIAHTLRTRDPKLYSHSIIGSLLGLSKATAFRRVSKGELKYD